MLTNDLRKSDVVLNAVLSTWGKGLCFFKGSKLVAGSIWKVEETSGKADNRLTSWKCGFDYDDFRQGSLCFFYRSIGKDIKLQSKTDLTAYRVGIPFILKSLRFKKMLSSEDLTVIKYFYLLSFIGNI